MKKYSVHQSSICFDGRDLDTQSLEGKIAPRLLKAKINKTDIESSLRKDRNLKTGPTEFEAHFYCLEGTPEEILLKAKINMASILAKIISDETGEDYNTLAKQFSEIKV